jgi:hypothetical protein
MVFYVNEKCYAHRQKQAPTNACFKSAIIPSRRIEAGLLHTGDPSKHKPVSLGAYYSRLESVCRAQFRRRLVGVGIQAVFIPFVRFGHEAMKPSFGRCEAVNVRYLTSLNDLCLHVAPEIEP